MGEGESEETRQDDTKRDDSAWNDLMESDLVMKVCEGVEGGKMAEMGDFLSIEVSGYVLEGDYKDDKDAAVRGATEGGKKFLDKQRISLTIGDSDVAPALEMGAKFLCEGGKAHVLSHSKFAYGATGRLGTESLVSVKALQNVLYDIAVISVLSSSSDQFTTKESQIERAAAKKMLANDCYANEWDGMGKSRALRLYAKAADMMSSLLAEFPNPIPADLHDTRFKATSLVIDCLNNVGAVHLRSRDYGKAKQACARVIELDRQNIKALCRAAHAAMRDPASTYEESDLAISAAEEVLEKLSPKDHPKPFIEVRRLRHDLTKRKRQYKQQQKEMSKKMFLSQEDADQKLAKECLNGAEDDRETKEKQDNSILKRYWNAFMETQDMDRWKRYWRTLNIQLFIMFLFSLWQKQHFASMRKYASDDGHDSPQELSTQNEGGEHSSEF
mmetsp:Transcript_16251/g.21549  ORF Transcript_16251/g.21549 Transcript_16251/m.21549 type:complete len:443 (-) Transcript_16251:1711-3039(-)